MELNEVVEEYLESIGGEQCKICNEWSDSDTFVGPICNHCNDQIEEVLAEAEDW